MDTLLDQAWSRRKPLVAALEATDAYRLFHGVAEGRPGLTVDRYGPLLLAQTFREPLTPADWAAIDAWDVPVQHRVYNHRGDGEVDWHDPPAEALVPHVCRELGLAFRIQARHRGDDPWWFLDLRAGRRWVRANAEGASVLNVFAYTCGLGIAALAGGARSVLNVDVSQTHLELGRANLAVNHLPTDRWGALAEDAIPVLRQLAELPVKGRGSRRPYVQLAARRFDLVILDPPTWARSPFGAIDIRRDYQALFKPALLATAEGGRLLLTNHAADVDADAWRAALERCAAKAGRPVQGTQLLAPEEDFPSFDGKPPLKILVVQT